MRLANLRKRIDAVNHRMNLFAENELQNLMQLAHGSHETTQQAPLFAEEEAKIQAGVIPSGRAAGDQTTGGCKRFQALCPRRDPDVLYDYVHTSLAGELFDFGRDVLRV